MSHSVDHACIGCGKVRSVARAYVRRGRSLCCRSCSSCSRRGRESRKVPLADRFAKRVDVNGPTMPHMTTPCHVWTGDSRPNGYGYLASARGRVGAHRVALFLKCGRWPEPCALHHCDNRSCVNPAHLYEGTPANNVRDAFERGRRAPTRGEHNGQAKLTAEQVREIRQLRKAGFNGREIGARFRISRSAVSLIATGQTWQHVRDLVPPGTQLTLPGLAA